MFRELKDGAPLPPLAAGMQRQWHPQRTNRYMRLRHFLISSFLVATPCPHIQPIHAIEWSSSPGPKASFAEVVPTHQPLSTWLPTSVKARIQCVYQLLRVIEHMHQRNMAYNDSFIRGLVIVAPPKGDADVPWLQLTRFARSVVMTDEIIDSDALLPADWNAAADVVELLFPPTQPQHQHQHQPPEWKEAQTLIHQLRAEPSAKIALTASLFGCTDQAKQAVTVVEQRWPMKHSSCREDLVACRGGDWKRAGSAGDEKVAAQAATGFWKEWEWLFRRKGPRTKEKLPVRVDGGTHQVQIMMLALWNHLRWYRRRLSPPKVLSAEEIRLHVCAWILLVWLLREPPFLEDPPDYAVERSKPWTTCFFRFVLQQTGLTERVVIGAVMELLNDVKGVLALSGPCDMATMLCRKASNGLSWADEQLAVMGQYALLCNGLAPELSWAERSVQLPLHFLAMEAKGGRAMTEEERQRWRAWLLVLYVPIEQRWEVAARTQALSLVRVKTAETFDQRDVKRGWIRLNFHGLGRTDGLVLEDARAQKIMSELMMA